MIDSMVDLCQSDPNKRTDVMFNPENGLYSISASDRDLVPIGMYTFEITGTAGDKSTSIIFTMEVVDPCFDAII